MGCWAAALGGAVTAVSLTRAGCVVGPEGARTLVALSRAVPAHPIESGVKLRQRLQGPHGQQGKLL